MGEKLLFINSLYYPNIGGGAEIICQEQVESFRDRGYDVSVLTTAPKGNGLIEDKVNGIKVYRAGIKNIYWHFDQNKPDKYHRMLWHLKDVYNLKMCNYVSSVIDIERPDVVVCHNITGFSIAVWDEIKKHKLPILQVLHDQYLLCANSNAFKNGKACEKQCFSCHIMRLPHRDKSKQVDAVVGVSAYVLNRFVENRYFIGVKQYVIHNARNIPDPGMKPLWNGVEPLCIGYIGTLSKVKGVEWLIRSFMELDIDATLTIAGRGESIEYENYLKQLAASDTRISFSGYVKSIDHYAQIHLSVVPSLWPDTFPTVAFESCANHVPVIATNMGGLPEIVKNGVNGLICSSSDKSDLKGKILEIYKNPSFLGDASQEARSSVLNLMDDNTQQYIHIMKDLKI